MQTVFAFLWRAYGESDRVPECLKCSRQAAFFIINVQVNTCIERRENVFIGRIPMYRGKTGKNGGQPGDYCGGIRDENRRSCTSDTD